MEEIIIRKENSSDLINLDDPVLKLRLVFKLIPIKKLDFQVKIILAINELLWTQ